MYVLCLVLIIFTSGCLAQGNQGGHDETDYTRQLCTGKGPGEWFRLGIDDCRDVVQCTDGGLQALRCPHGLAFDLNLQTCDWKKNVQNCNVKEKVRKPTPLLNTREPICQEGELACGDEVCILQEKFCNGVEDCTDGSDETLCDILNDPNRAPTCDKTACALPDCYCYNNAFETPLNLPPAKIPQMVLITFDDAVNNNNMDLYEYIFDGQRLNPNGCTIKSTFFVSHKYTNYTAVQELNRHGHEIALHSISHNDSESFWSHASPQEWAREMSGMRDIINTFANVSDVVGMRAPYLRVGGNNQFGMMEQEGIFYDSTITAPLQTPPLWPYMLFYKMPHDCHGNGQRCPTRPFATWEMVMNEMDRREDPTIREDLPGCAMVDSCFSTKSTPEQFFKFLENNFNRHYQTNRAPFGLFFHSAFLKNDPEILETLLLWMKDILATLPDVYFVTMTDVLYWLQDPQTIDTIENFEPWKTNCHARGEPACPDRVNNCELVTDELPGETIRLATCMKCPKKYPWLSDPKGHGRGI